MKCSKCDENKTTGVVQDGEFVCNECFVKEKTAGIIKQRAWKQDWRMVAVLKHHGIRGNMAAVYVGRLPVEFLRRRVWCMRFMIDKNRVTKSKWCLMKSLIENKYPEPEEFHAWLKYKLDHRRQGDFQVLYE